MKTHINPYRLLMALCSLIITVSVYATPTIPPQNNPAAAANYSKVAPDWQVSSVYGPRNPGSSGSKLHKGIDYNQQQGDGDLGVLLRARERGTITALRQGWITIAGGFFSFDYIHSFDTPTVSNANTQLADYSKVALTKVKANAGKGTCGAVFFYDIPTENNIPAKLVKILTSVACSNYVEPNNGKQIKAQVYVEAEEPIAPMGKSGTNNAHLHLQLNGGADNALTQITHSKATIADKKQFEVKLVQDTFTDKVLNAMTKGQGFAIQVTENSLVPVLDKIAVQDESGKELQTFSFGGQLLENPENVSESNIVPTLDLTKGSATPKIKPKSWGEMGTPRTMTFFVPYSQFATLADGKHTLSVTITTIDDEVVTEQLDFVKNPPFIKIANNGKELPDSALLGNQPTDWACLKDTKTGLIWEVKTDDGGLRDKDWLYSWYDPQYLPDVYHNYNNRYAGYYDSNGDGFNDDGSYYDPDGFWAGWENPEQPPYNIRTRYYNNTFNSLVNTNKELCNAKPVHCNTLAYKQTINTKKLCDADDWRLPNIDELRDVVLDWPYTDYNNSELFQSSFWSSSILASIGSWGNQAGVVGFDKQSGGSLPLNEATAVRLVRDGQPRPE